MTRTIALALASVALAGCLDDAPAPATAAPPPPPRLEAACEAMRSAFPISFASPGDTPETVRQVREANARFAVTCP